MGLERVSETKISSGWHEGMPTPLIFPTGKLPSHADAAMLDKWITSVLDRYAEKMAAQGNKGTSVTESVDELVPALSLGLHELTRQVSQLCAERGVVLEKIWRTYVELFEKTLAQTRALLRFHHTRTQRVKDELRRSADELAEKKQRHPDQVHKLSSTLAVKFEQRQEELGTLLKNVKRENEILKQAIQEQTDGSRSWFPQFGKYKDSHFRIALQGVIPELPSSTTPEARIAADFKRILIALPPDARRRVGFFVSSLLGIRGTDLVEHQETLESISERKDHNAWKINLLERRVRELRERAATTAGNEVSP